MDKKILGAKIAYYRKLKNMTQQDLADKSKVSVQTIKSIENGKGNPTLDMLNKITEMLNISLYHICKGDNKNDL